MRGKKPAEQQGAREAVILFTAGGFKFAIAANAVSEIRNVDGLQDLPPEEVALTGGKVRMTVERNGTTYFAVEVARHFHLPESRPARLLVLRHAPAALLVDSTDRMTEISTLHGLPQCFTGDERIWYRGLAVMNGDVVPVVNQAAFLRQAEIAQLESAAQPLRGAVVV